MKLTILGTGDAFCTGGRFNTCLKLEADGGVMLIDCGSTSMLALERDGVNRARISTILATHYHGDHFGAVPAFLLDAMFVTRRTAPLLIAGPKGVAERTRTAMEAMFPGYLDMSRNFDLRFQDVTPQARATIDGYVIEAFPVVHDERVGPCQGYRLSRGGKVFAFSGDTTWTESLVPLARGSDLFLCECYKSKTKMPNHLDWATLEGRLGDLAAGTLVITHMSGEMLAFHDPIPAIRAVDGMKLEIPELAI